MACMETDDDGPLDILALLTVSLRHNFWPYLDHESQMELRRTSGHARSLAEQLASRFTLNFEAAPPGGGGAADPWVVQLGACLGRHEHIQLLRLRPGDGEVCIVEGLRLGRAACRRVREVQLLASSPVTAATGDAIAQACPELRVLCATGAASMQAAAFFTPLQGLAHLTTVKLDSATFATMDALASLPHLRSLECAGAASFPGPTALARVSTLTALQSLLLTTPLLLQPAALHSLGAALTALTRLTHLGLASQSLAAPQRQADALAMAAAGTLLARLGALPHLTSLNVSQLASPVDDAALLALCQLSGLTALHATGFALQHPGPPSALRHLQELHLPHTMTGAAFLACLQLLLPLPCLAVVSASLAFQGSSASPAASAAERAALQQATKLLAAAPRLQRVHLTLSDATAGGRPHTLSSAFAALEGVRPWLRRLEVRGGGGLPAAHLGAFDLLLAPFGSLQELRLAHCTLDSDVLLGVALQCTSLRRLELGAGCVGATAGLAMAVAVAREAPLRVVWPLSKAEVGEVRVVLAALGKAHVSFNEDPA